MSVYSDKSGYRWWIKAWFNNHEFGENAVEIDLPTAIDFIHSDDHKDVWLEKYFPEHMKVYHSAIEQTKEQILRQFSV